MLEPRGRVATELRSWRKELSAGRWARGRRWQLWEKPRKQRGEARPRLLPFSSSPNCQHSCHSAALSGKLRNSTAQKEKDETQI